VARPILTGLAVCQSARLAALLQIAGAPRHAADWHTSLGSLLTERNARAVISVAARIDVDSRTRYSTAEPVVVPMKRYTA
jgi:hypothetical protein